MLRPTTTLMTARERNGIRDLVPRSRGSTSNPNPRRPDQGINAKASYARYVALARAAALTGDTIETENYYQHAEHFFRQMKEQSE